MIRKFRKIFRPTTTPTKADGTHSTSSPESTSDETHYVKQVSSSINKQLFTGRQNEFFSYILLFFFRLIFLIMIIHQGQFFFLYELKDFSSLGAL